MRQPAGGLLMHLPGSPVARGIGLFDALIALAILAIGMLAMTRLQSRLIAQNTETTTRLTAQQIASTHLNTVLVDRANAACYTVPQHGTCNNDAAKALTDEWSGAATAALPSGTAKASLSGNSMVVTLTWRGRDQGDTRTYRGMVDVR